ncbi:MAG: SMP-30/gluconolactonase/LRE family protein [Henriciella sp.]|nr:SMP-30/gluconolactonase/LRE family protein [Henriciella sp.]
MISRRATLAGLGAVGLAACATGRGVTQSSGGLTDLGIDAISPELSKFVATDAPIETLATGYQWSEGPTWDRARARLYFTDVPQNKAFLWRRDDAVSVFMDPSGGADTEGFREPGANGLWYAADGSLLICNHGHRAVERMDLETGEVTSLANSFDGQKLNSPNDLVQARNGVIYFTDPPYGLEGLNDSPLKQQDANGVYRLDPDGSVTRLVSDMTFPNGIALSPDQSVLYVSQSDPDAPLLRAFELSQSGDVISNKVLFDASSYMHAYSPGLPDGMAVCDQGGVFVTGPGGVFVLDPNGRVLGRVRTGGATANCAFGEDGRTLFITAGDRLLRVRTKVQGVQWSS